VLARGILYRAYRNIHYSAKSGVDRPTGHARSAQITWFAATRDGHARYQVAAHIGGSVRATEMEHRSR
jgi:hypothetical protein